ncbi:hypothetical protein ABKN59_007180 [Abortiporus biennis]
MDDFASSNFLATASHLLQDSRGPLEATPRQLHKVLCRSHSDGNLYMPWIRNSTKTRASPKISIVEVS